MPHRIIRSSKAGKNVFFVDFAHETEGKLDKIFQSSEKASELSYSIMNIIYILAAMIIVVAIFTVVLYIYKFIMNRRDPNYKKNDDTFLDD